MSTVLRFDGLRVTIYPNDHRPAHVHVKGADVYVPGPLRGVLDAAARTAALGTAPPFAATAGRRSV